MEIIPLGDSALVLRVDEHFERDPETTLHAVLDLQRRLQHAEIPGVVEYAPAYTSLGLFFDPVKANAAGAPAREILPWLKAQIARTLAQTVPEEATTSKPLTVEIPVCYDAEFALDLDDVAEHTGLSPNEIKQRHSGAEYLVHGVGFTPGFPYLGGLPLELAMPRRATPRKEVPAGSVAIGGVQTGVYPTASPGGWNIIGRTPLRLFDPQRQPPALLAAGMRVRFCALTRTEFDALLP